MQCFTSRSLGESTISMQIAGEDLNNKRPLGGSPGLVVRGDDSCLRGRGFESQCFILDGFDIFRIYLL